jgi:abhydrolase domain-containing protein 6
MSRQMILLLALAAATRWTASAADPEALAGRTIVIGGIAIHYVDTMPSGGGTTLLCVHGYNGSSAETLPLMRRLPSSWRLVAVDLPGNGKSGKPDMAYRISGFVDFLSAFCAQVGLSRFTLLGHSMGGQIAVHFTHRFPGMVERLILLDPYGLEGEAGAWMFLAQLGPVVDIAMAMNTRLFLEIAMRSNLFYDPDKATAEYLDAAADALLSPEGRASSARITREVLGTEPVDGILPLVGQDTLLLWGREDKVLDAQWARRFAELLPHAELHVLPRCGHSPAVELPDETAALVRSFVEGGGA